MEKKYNVIKKDNHTVIQVLAKKLDTSIAPAFKSELVMIAGNGESNMIIDLSNTEYCDSSGLSSILVANRLCKNGKGQFVLSGLQSAVERLITISQLDSVLEIADNLELAEQKFNGKS